MTVMVFGYLILISIDFTILFPRFLLSFSFDCEDISNTQDSVWPHFQTPQSSSKILRYTSYSQLSSRCLEMWSNIVFRVWYITSNISCWILATFGQNSLFFCIHLIIPIGLYTCTVTIFFNIIFCFECSLSWDD